MLTIYVTGGKLHLQATDGANGYELWKSDGTTAGMVQVIDLNAGGASGFGFVLD